MIITRRLGAAETELLFFVDDENEQCRSGRVGCSRGEPDLTARWPAEWQKHFMVQLRRCNIIFNGGW